MSEVHIFCSRKENNQKHIFETKTKQTSAKILESSEWWATSSCALSTHSLSPCLFAHLLPFSQSLSHALFLFLPFAHAHSRALCLLLPLTCTSPSFCLSVCPSIPLLSALSFSPIKLNEIPLSQPDIRILSLHSVSLSLPPLSPSGWITWGAAAHITVLPFPVRINCVAPGSIFLPTWISAVVLGIWNVWHLIEDFDPQCPWNAANRAGTFSWNKTQHCWNRRHVPETFFPRHLPLKHSFSGNQECSCGVCAAQLWQVRPDLVLLTVPRYSWPFRLSRHSFGVDVSAVWNKERFWSLLVTLHVTQQHEQFHPQSQKCDHFRTRTYQQTNGAAADITKFSSFLGISCVAPWNRVTIDSHISAVVWGIWNKVSHTSKFTISILKKLFSFLRFRQGCACKGCAKNFTRRLHNCLCWFLEQKGTICVTCQTLIILWENSVVMWLLGVPSLTCFSSSSFAHCSSVFNSFGRLFTFLWCWCVCERNLQ